MGHVATAGIKRAVAEHRPKMVFLTSPNNPDGSMLSTEELLEILKLPTLVRAAVLRAASLCAAVVSCWIRRTSSCVRSCCLQHATLIWCLITAGAGTH